MTEQRQECPVCLGQADVRQDQTRGMIVVDCPRCGSYQASDEAVSDVLTHKEDRGPSYPVPGPHGSQRRARLSAWLQDHPGVLLTTELVQEKLTSLVSPPVLEVVDRALLALDVETQSPGEAVNLNTPRWQGRLYVWNLEGVVGWAKIMKEFGYVHIGERAIENTELLVTIAAKGWERLERLREVNPDSPQGFIAMWFDPSMGVIYDKALAPAIEAAGYRPHRVDQRQYIGRVDDEIVAQIRRSRFVVADFTGHRGGVYWEAGLAEGLGLPVIFTCRKDAVKNLHFDVRQNNTITWEDDGLDEFRQNLRSRIEAVLGRGPIQPSPVSRDL